MNKNRKYAKAASWSKGERRIYKRRQLIYYLELFDGKHEQCIGHVVDISPEGMLVMSDKPFGICQTYRFSIVYKQPGCCRHMVQVTARSRWCMPGMHAHFYDTGFELVGIDKETAKAIDTIIATLCY
ncbi:MAG: PilZ domain-containing protein [Desulfobacterota bacterium]|nr:PilZ domain-containing protein [Thermodesulfobacteriota bacterium]